MDVELPDDSLHKSEYFCEICTLDFTSQKVSFFLAVIYDYRIKGLLISR